MSAPSPDNPESLTSSGYQDGLGRRTLVFDRGAGVTIERLTLRPEFTLFERALAGRAERLATFDDERVARVRGVQRDPTSGALTVDSDCISGGRLSDLIDAVADGTEESAGAGLDVAVGFLLELLPALGALHTTAGMAHGVVGPGRIILTTRGHIVLVDSLFGEALQQLQFTPARLWAEFGLALPAVAGPARLDVAADLSQAGLTALMLALGRPLRPHDFPSGLPSALAEVLEIAQIRGSAPFAARLEQFLQQILPLGSRRPFSSAKDAFNELRDFAGIELGVANCRTALGNFYRDAGAALDAQRIRLASAMADLPPAPAAVVAPEPEPEPIEVEAPVPVLVRPEPWSVPEPVVEHYVEAVAAAPIDQPAEPIRAFEPAVIDLPVVAAAPEPAAAPPEVDEEPETPAAAAASARRKRQRGPRAKRDKLRSNAAPPAPLSTPVIPTPAPAPPAPLIVAPVAPVEMAPPPRPPAPPIRMPFSSPPAGGEQGSPYTSDRFWETPTSAPVPIAAPIPIAPSIAIAAQKPPVPPSMPAAPAPLRVKAQPPAGYAPPSVHRPAPRVPQADYVSSPSTFAARGQGRAFPWKIAAAAVVIIGVGITASWGFLSDRGASAAAKPAAATAAPAPAKAPPAAPAVGTIVVASTPSGAKVLLDGAAAGETPITLSDVPAGRRVITLVSDAGTVRRTVRVVAGKTLSLDVPVYSGFVNISAPIILEVAIGGRSMGTTEQGRLLLPPGRHELTLSNRDLDYTATHMVEIESGEELRTSVQPRAMVSINAIPWAEVWIDGQRAGETPLAKMPIVLGTHEFTFKNPQFPDRRITTTIKGSSPSTLSVDFTKPERQ